MSATERLDYAKVNTINSLASAAEAVVLDPSDAIKNPEAVTLALESLLESWEALVAATSQGNPHYALRSLSADTADCHKRAQHAIKVLQQLHCPKAVPA